MTVRKMHTDELEIDAPLVRRLIGAQFPEWAELPIARVPSDGTDNALFHLGPTLVVRLPRIGWALERVEKEQRWLPRLAPLLPLPVPEPVAMGIPACGYPWPWSVYRWLPGENPTFDRLADPREAARQLAAFINALHEIDATGGPPPGPHNSDRGVPLAARDAATRKAIGEVEEKFDRSLLTKAWEAALSAHAWDGPACWIHGDLSPGNLLALDGHLSAVIDFGCLGVGDPACDLMIAWTLFTGESRDAFRAALGCDQATWERGRGWALSWALIYIPYYRESNPAGVNAAARTIAELTARAYQRVR